MIFLCMDVGNVLVKANFTPFKRQLSKTLNIPMEQAQDFLNRTQKLHDLGFTRIADELKDHFKIHSQVIIEELLQYWNDSIDIADYMFDKLLEISQKRELKIALLSNIGFDHVEKLENMFSVGTGHHKNLMPEAIRHFSCHVGARKPSLVYYQSFLQLHPVFKNALYIDDLQENLDASKQFGFKTLRFALDEITGDNYSEPKYSNKMKELEDFILSYPKTKNPRRH
jgi:HAD superfamily hydrolase (TIGR01509 family)